MKKYPKNFIHDSFFKEVFSHPKYAKGLFQLKSLKQHFHFLNFNTLKLQATTFIDTKGRERRTDLQFSIETKDSKEKVTLLFLIEHKSYQDPYALLQMLIYQTGIYQFMATDKESRKPLIKGLTPVIPILVYQGPDKDWKGPQEFQEYLNWTEDLKRRFGEHVVNFRPYFLNIAGLDLEKEDKGLTIYPVLFILKNIYALDKVKVGRFFKLSQDMSIEDRRVLLKSVVSYIKQYDPYFSWDLLRAIEAEVIPEKEGRFMSLFEQVLEEEREKVRKQARQEGWQEGRQEISLNLLSAGLDLKVVSKCTGLSEEEINKLKNGSDS